LAQTVFANCSDIGFTAMIGPAGNNRIRLLYFCCLL
jgi:hypothetical protein